eukprot:2408724-Prymnesium_polylepis.1
MPPTRVSCAFLGRRPGTVVTYQLPKRKSYQKVERVAQPERVGHVLLVGRRAASLFFRADPLSHKTRTQLKQEEENARDHRALDRLPDDDERSPVPVRRTMQASGVPAVSGCRSVESDVVQRDVLTKDGKPGARVDALHGAIQGEDLIELHDKIEREAIEKRVEGGWIVGEQHE